MFLPREMWAHVLLYAPHDIAPTARKRRRDGNREQRRPVWIGAALLRVSWSAHMAARAALFAQPAGRGFLRGRLLQSGRAFPGWLTDALAPELRTMGPSTARMFCYAAVDRNDPREWVAIAGTIGVAVWAVHANALGADALAAAIAATSAPLPRAPPALTRAVGDAYASSDDARAAQLLSLAPPRGRLERCLAQHLGPARPHYELVAECIAARDDAVAAMAVARSRFRGNREDWRRLLLARCCARRAVRAIEALVVHYLMPLNHALFASDLASWCSALTLQAFPNAFSVFPAMVLGETLCNPDAAVARFAWAQCPERDALFEAFAYAADKSRKARSENVAAVLDQLPDAAQRAVVEFVFLPGNSPQLLGVADALAAGLLETLSNCVFARLRDSAPLAEQMALAVPRHTPRYDPALRMLCTMPHPGVWDALINYHKWSVALKRHN